LSARRVSSFVGIFIVDFSSTSCLRQTKTSQMTEQTAPSAPPLLPPSSSADGGGSSHRLRRSNTTNSDNYGPDNNNRRRSPPSSSAPGVQRQPSQPISDGERRRSGDSRRSNTATGSSRRQPPVELAMSFHSASDQPLPPPPPVSVRSSSSVRRSSSVGTNQSQSQSQSQAQAQKRKKKGASQTSAAVPAQAGAASADERITRASSRSNSRSKSSRPPSRSNSHIRESAATSTSTAAAAASELAASVAATQAELERRQSRLAEIRQRSDAEKYELTIQEEAKKIRRLQKTQRNQEEEMIRMQQQQQQRRQNQTLNVEAPLDFSAPTRPVVGTTAVAVVGRESGSSHSNTSIEDAIVRGDSSMSGAGTQSQKSNKRNTTGNLTGQQRRQSQQRHNSATIAAVPALSANPSASVRSSVAADEALARKLQNDMLREQEAVRAMEQQFQDEEMARSLAAAEAARMTSLGLSPDDMIDGTDGGRGRSSSRGGGGGCCNTMHKMVSFVIMAGCVGVVLFVLFGIVYRSAGGDPEALPPWFRDAWDDRSGWEGDYGQGANASDFQRWRIGRNKKGLKLTLINGLSDDWNDHFYQAIEDWNEAGALELATVLDNEGPPCEKHTRGMVKTCNGDYGRTDWTGLNELLFENGWIVSSVAMMNENYLRNARDVERQYVMCHELGHAWGLPHRDEIVGNRDLGTCLDYTITPQNNMKPDEIDFENLSQMYGEVTIGRGRRLKMTASAGGADMFVSSYTNTTHLAHGTKRSTTTRSTREGRSDRVLLHKSDSHEIWEEDLGNGRRLVTKVLLSIRRD